MATHDISGNTSLARPSVNDQNEDDKKIICKSFARSNINVISEIQ